MMMPAPAFAALADQVVMLGCQAGIGNLKRVEDTKLDQTGKVGELARNAEEANQALFSKVFQQLDQAGLLQCLGIASMKLQQVDVIGAKPLQDSFRGYCESRLGPNDGRSQDDPRAGCRHNHTW